MIIDNMKAQRREFPSLMGLLQESTVHCYWCKVTIIPRKKVMKRGTHIVTNYVFCECNGDLHFNICTSCYYICCKLRHVCVYILAGLRRVLVKRSQPVLTWRRACVMELYWLNLLTSSRQTKCRYVKSMTKICLDTM